MRINSSDSDANLERGFLLPYTPNFEFFQTEEDAKKVIGILRLEKVLAVDTETSGLDPWTNNLLLLQIATPDKCYILNCVKVNPGVWNPILNDSSILKILQNVSFDYKFLKRHAGVDIRNVFDTMLAEQILVMGKGTPASLQYLSSKYLGIDLDKDIRLEFTRKGKQAVYFSRKELLYAANDALILHPIYSSQVNLLQRDGLINTALLEFNTVIPTAEMELNGIRLDATKWRTLLEVVKRNVKESENEIKKIFLPTCNQLTIWGECTINIASQKQLLVHLRKLGIELEDTQEYTLSNVTHPIGPLLLKWRGYNKLITSYGEKLLSRVNQKTNRLHTSLRQIGTDTARYSSSSPNLHQVPKFNPKDPDSLNFRSCFIPSVGNKMVCADYDQEELRILAEMSGDKELIEAYALGDDVHTKTAAALYNKSPSEITDGERSVGKTVNFSVGYGAGKYKIAGLLKISEEEAQEIIDNYFKTFSGVKHYMYRASNFVLSNSYAKSIIGRRRYFKLPSVEDDDYKKRISSVKRRGANMPIQSSGSDVGKQALCNFFYGAKERNLDVQLLLMVHDEILCECPAEIAEDVSKLLEESMEEAFKTFFKKVPMKVDACIADHWTKS